MIAPNALEENQKQMKKVMKPCKPHQERNILV